MSIRVMAMVWEHGPRKPADRLLLLAIADHADDYGLAWPSLARLAEKTAVEEQAARRGVQRLENAGWLSVVRGGGTIDGKHGRTSRYQVNMAKLATLSSEAGLPGPTLSSTPGYPAFEGASTLPSEAGEPSREPSKNQDSRPAEPDMSAPDLFGEVVPLRSQSVDEGFEEWWKLYPRKDGKQHARKAYTKLRREGLTAGFLLEAIRGARDRLLESDPQYRPMGSTWLNGRRWEDEPGDDLAAELNRRDPGDFGFHR